MEKDPAVFQYEKDEIPIIEGNLRERSVDRRKSHEQAAINGNNGSFHDPPSRRISQHEQNGHSTSPAPIDPRRISTHSYPIQRETTSLTLTPEMFEKLYMNPPSQGHNDLTKRFANPTPIGLLGFLLTASPLSCELMGFMGAGGGGAATTGAYYFIGGFLMSLCGILEFFLGNTFSFVVFTAYGGFWFTLGATLTPFFNAYGAYSPDPANPALGLQSAQFHASLGTYHPLYYRFQECARTSYLTRWAGFLILFMGLLSLIVTICALRTNMIFVSSFTALTLLFAILTGSYWNTAIGSMDLAKQQQFVAGGFGLVAVSGGWYMFLAQMLASVDFPLQLPVGDLSHMIKPLSARVKEKEMYSA